MARQSGSLIRIRDSRDIVTENLFDKIHSDPRRRPFLRKIGKAPDQLAKIQFKTHFAAEL